MKEYVAPKILKMEEVSSTKEEITVACRCSGSSTHSTGTNYKQNEYVIACRCSGSSTHSTGTNYKQKNIKIAV